MEEKDKNGDSNQKPTGDVYAERQNFLYGGMSISSFAVIAQLSGLQQSEYDLPQIVTLYAFANTIPFSILFLIGSLMGFNKTKSEAWAKFAGFVATTSFIIGLTALFYHFSIPIGFVFSCAALIAATSLVFSIKLSEIDKQLDEAKKLMKRAEDEKVKNSD